MGDNEVAMVPDDDASVRTVNSMAKEMGSAITHAALEPAAASSDPVKTHGTATAVSGRS
jgi:hypothetical protein